MKVSNKNFIIILFIDLIPGINNYNPMKNKSKKFGSPFNDINIMSNNNPRSNNFIKRGNKNNYDRNQDTENQ